MAETDTEKHYIYIDFLKIIAFLGVVTMHTTALVILAPPDGTDCRQYLTYLNAATRFCVPMYILCSGAMILRKPIDDIKNFFLKRFSRVVVPFIFWGIIYEIVINGVTNPLTMAQDFYYHKVSFHLWFVYMIVVAYLFAPVLADVVQKLSLQKLNYMLGVWIMFACVVEFGFLIKDTSVIALYRLCLFTGYFLAGWMIHNRKIFSLKLSGLQLLLISAAVVAVAAWLINTYTENQNKFYDSLVSPYTILIILWSLAIFQYFREHEDFFTSRPKLAEWITKIGALIYGGYLIHVLFREYLKDFFFVTDGTFYAGNYSYLTVAGCASLTLILSLIAVAILYKIPYLRRLV